MQAEIVETQMEEYQKETRVKRMKEAERMEDRVSTTEEESTYKRTEHMEVENRKRDENRGRT